MINEVDSIKGYDIIIDVVAKEYYDEEHIKGAINICAYETAFVEKIEAKYPDKETKLLVYGPTSAEGLYAIEKLDAAGYENAVYLLGGLDRYSDQGGEVEITRRYNAPKIEDGEYKIDREKSFVYWTGRNKSNQHRGSIDCTSGTVKILVGVVREGAFSLDPHTLKCFDLEGNSSHDYLIKHLQHSDFLCMKKYPSVQFHIINVTPINRANDSENNYDVVAELTMRGKTQKIVFEASIHPTEDGISVLAHFDIDRTEWGMVYGSERFLRHLGMHVLKDEVTIELHLFFKPDI